MLTAGSKVAQAVCRMTGVLNKPERLWEGTSAFNGIMIIKHISNKIANLQ